MIAARFDKAEAFVEGRSEEHTSELHALYVLPHQRRQGMAVNALTMAARWTESEGGHWIGLAVEEHNTAARALYESLGFVEAGRYHYRMHPEDTK